MKYNIFTYFYILFLFLISVYGAICIGTTERFSQSAIYLWGVVSVILLVLGIIAWYKQFKNFKSPFIYYYIISYFYFFGEVFLKLIGYKSDITLEIDNFADYNLLIKTVIFSCIGYGMLYMGAMAFSKIFKLDVKEEMDSIKDKYLRKATNIVGWTMFLVSAPIYAWDLAEKLYISMTYGYGGIFDYSGEVNFTSALGGLSKLTMFFFTSLFLILTAGKHNKKTIIFCNIIMGIFSVVTFACGIRAGGVVLLLAYIWFYFISIKKVSMKKIVIIGIIGVLLLNIISITRKVRSKGNRTLENYIDAISENKEGDGAIISAVREMGYSIFPTYHTINIISQNHDYHYGYTYFAGLMAVFPSFMFGGYSFASTAVLSDWLMNELNMTYSPGYSLLAESFYNFGYFGVIAMFILGGIVMIMLSNNKKEHDDIIIKNAFIASAITFIAISARGMSLLFIKQYVYTILLPYLAIKIVSNTLRKKGVNN